MSTEQSVQRRLDLTLSLEQRVAVGLGRAVARWMHEFEQMLKQYGLTPTQYNVLRILNGAGGEGLCGIDIGRRLVSQVPDVTRLLDRIEDAGWIERERDPSNRRFVTARLTKAGRDKLIETTPVIDQMHREQFQHFSEAQLKSLLAMFPDAINPG